MGMSEGGRRSRRTGDDEDEAADDGKLGVVVLAELPWPTCTGGRHVRVHAQVRVHVRMRMCTIGEAGEGEGSSGPVSVPLCAYTSSTVGVSVTWNSRGFGASGAAARAERSNGVPGSDEWLPRRTESRTLSPTFLLVIR